MTALWDRLRSDSSGEIRLYYKLAVVAWGIMWWTGWYLRFTFRLTRRLFMFWRLGALGTSELSPLQRAMFQGQYSQLDRRHRREAKRILRNAARRYPWAAGAYASIASPTGMGNDGKVAYDLATRTWYGGVVGNVQAAGDPWFDARNPTFAGGALGNGVANDTVPWQATINAAYAAGGGTAYGSGGTYLVDLLLNQSYVTMRGSGWGSTIFKSRSAVDMINLASARTEETGYVDFRMDGNFVGANGLLIAGNDSQTNGPFASGFNNPRHRTWNLLIRNFTVDGYHHTGDGFAGEDQVVALQIYFCGVDNFYMSVPDSIIADIDCGQAGSVGMHIAAGNNKVVGCKSWLSGRVTAANGYGFQCTSLPNLMIVACDAQDNGKTGYTFFASQQVNATGLVADSNGQLTTGYGVDLDTAQGNYISVAAYDRQGTPTQLYAVRVAAGTKNIVHIVCGVEATGAISAADLLTDNVFIVQKIGSSAQVYITGGSVFSGQTGINGAAATNRDLVWYTAGVLRWIIRGNTDAESGSNAGTALQLLARDDSGAALKTVMTITRANGVIQFGNKIWPASDAGAQQTNCGLFANTGAPNNANGANGDIYFRSDGGAGTTIYQRRAGAWVGIV